MKTTEFCLIRHGETDWNIQGLYQGSTDIELNDTGIAQANALAEAMTGEEWDAIAASPLLRALETARIIAPAVGIDPDAIETDPRLQERGYGVAEGLTLVQREEQYPGEEWQDLETIPTLHARALAGMEALVAAYAGKRVVVVTHGRWIMEVVSLLTDGAIELPPGSILNTSRTYLTLDDDGWHIGEIGVADHLEGVSA